MRWNPVLREWMVISPLEPGEKDTGGRPLCVYCQMAADLSPDEGISPLPAPDGPLNVEVPPPRLERDTLFRVAPARGRCEVFLHSKNHEDRETDFSVEQWLKIAEAWSRRTAELGPLPDVHYLHIFEAGGGSPSRRPHPLSRLYTFPFIPARIQRMITAAWDDWQRSQNCLFCRILARELTMKERVVLEGEHLVAFVPYAARFPYEVHIYPRRHLLRLPEMTPEELAELASMIRTLLQRYRRVLGEEFAYSAAQHAAPTSGPDCSFYHWHMEWVPRSEETQEWALANAFTIGGGPCVRYSLAEEDARKLREAGIA